MRHLRLVLRFVATGSERRLWALGSGLGRFSKPAPVATGRAVCACGADERETHHDPCEQTHAFPTVRVRHHVPVADGEEGDRNEPHGSQEVTGHFLFVVIPEAAKR